MQVTGPRGTNDILPGDVERWHLVEERIRSLCRIYGYHEIRTPIFEHTELFVRGIGEATDIVEKEMYTFTDKGDRSITLRPEGTAPVVRAYLEHKLYAGANPIKLYYMGPMFRYERPQAGRYRQFSQFGVEVFGSQHPVVDAETIALPVHLYETLGIKDVRVQINTIGCPKCRPAYRKLLKDSLRDRVEKLCPSCQRRYERNPLRLLDCKEESCRRVTTDIPTIYDSLCEECRDHFDRLQVYLKAAGIAFEVNPRLVRGFDYYTKTVFEFSSSSLGAQDALGGGGRYDGLVEEVGGQPTPGIGFAVGIDRILLAMERQGVAAPDQAGVEVFFASLGEAATLATVTLLSEIRHAGIPAEMDYLGRSLRAQLKAADKSHARYAVIIGDTELARGAAVIRTLATGEQTEVPLGEVVPYLEKFLKQS